MTWARWSVPCLLALAACGTKESGSSDPQLRSDMPARSASFYVEHRDELTEMETVCGAWRASQRPAASWPSVVFGPVGPKLRFWPSRRTFWERGIRY